MAHAWPVDVVALRPIACGSVLWRADASLRLTVVVKATFGLVHEGTARLIAPVPLVLKDAHRERSPARSVERAADLAPYLAKADVLVEGSAHAPPGRATPAASVRVSLFRGQPILDKTLHVFGDRSPQAPGAPAAFQSMPITYERAYGGQGFDANPVGVGAAPDARVLPNIVDPKDPRSPAGFGPISRSWPSRRNLLDVEQRRALALDIPELGPTFPSSFLQAAPPDQQCDFLHGDEWIVLDGMSPSSPRLTTRLPGVRAVVRAHVVDANGVSPATALELAADMLVIDVNQNICSMTLRGALPVSDVAALGALRVFASVELQGAPPTSWPSDAQIWQTYASTPSIPEASAAGPRPSLDRTTVVDEEALSRRSATPFVPAPPPSRPQPVFPDPPALGPAVAMGPPLAFDPPRSASEQQAQTSMISLEELREAAARTLAPFAVAPAGERSDRAPSVAGTPWDPGRQADHDGGGPHTPLRAAPAIGAEPPSPPSTPATRKARPEPPPRVGEVARIINASALSAATLPWQIRPPRDSITVVVKGTFDLVADGPARPRDESDLVIGDLHVDDDPEKSLAYASDFAVLKPRADVTVVGHGYAPRGRAPAAQVVFRFGSGKSRIDRTLHVFGDRRWQRLAPTLPAPFEKIPLVYERAFGGPSFDANPLGVGHKAAEGADGVARLPNVELPDKHITSPGDAPPPACLAPIPVLWKERWSRLGTYDRAWFRTRWPYFPEDFDWAFFQSAPVAQRLEKITGDEPYEIAGMIASHPLLRGKLPGVRARAFAQRTKEAGGTFTELRLVLDTAAFDADAMKVNLVWRGHLEVSDEDAPEIQHWFVMSEPLASTPATLEQARELYLATAVPEAPAAEEPDQPKPANETRPPPEPRDPAMEELDRLLEEHQKARAAAVGEGDGAPPPPPPPPDPVAIAATLRAGGASEAEVAGVLELLKPPEERDDEPGSASPPVVDRAFVLAMLKAGKRFDGMNLEGLDLSDLDFSRRSLAEVHLRGAKLCRAVFSGATLTGALLSGADLTEARLDDASLGGTDFVGATLEGASLVGASLDGADFTGAKADRADFKDAIGDKAVFAGASLRKARFDGTSLGGADFSEAVLAEASFVGADLTKVRMYDVKGERIVLDKAILPNARLEGASFPRGSLKEIEAPGAVLERADLTEATLFGAALAGASLLRARCARAVLSRADLSGARLRRADLRGAAMLKTNLFEANLERADLTGADLRGANLHGAGLWKAKLEDAKLDTAIVTKSSLVMRKP